MLFFFVAFASLGEYAQASKHAPLGELPFATMQIAPRSFLIPKN